MIANFQVTKNLSYNAASHSTQSNSMSKTIALSQSVKSNSSAAAKLEPFIKTTAKSNSLTSNTLSVNKVFAVTVISHSKTTYGFNKQIPLTSSVKSTSSSRIRFAFLNGPNVLKSLTKSNSNSPKFSLIIKTADVGEREVIYLKGNIDQTINLKGVFS